MKKLNNKGVTLIELIVSFMLVSVAIIYFFQTLYTVKDVYSTARRETNEFVIKDYALRIIDAYSRNNTLSSDNIFFNYKESRIVTSCSGQTLNTSWYKYDEQEKTIKTYDVEICNFK